MNRSMLTLSGLAVAFVLAGCASESTAPAAKPAAASAAPAAPALSDAAIAEKFKGQWTGEWAMPGVGSGKFILKTASVVGNEVKGEVLWYGTAVGDVKSALKKATVEKGVLNAVQENGWQFKLKPKSDTQMVGTWDISGYSGDLKVSR